MLSTFRRLIYSKAGAIVTGVVLVLIALAFAGGDVSSLRSQGLAALGGSGSGSDAARVGNVRIDAAELTRRAQQDLANFRAQQPTLTMAQYIAGNGLDGTLQRQLSGLALEQFGHSQGMRISKRAVDGQIASFPGLQGPNGEFDPTIFRQVLANQKISERDFRADLGRDLLTQALTIPLSRIQTVPQQLAVPYADLLLERRQGLIAFVPTQAMTAGPPPTEAELQSFYTRNIARYTVPERRVIRYARVTPERVQAQAAPGEAEIAAAYNADRLRYAPTEQRTVTTVVVLDAAGAAQLAAKVKNGQSLAAAAAAAGLSSSVKAGLTRAALATQTSTAVADAVFGAANGAVVGPIRGGIGFTVAHVDRVAQVAGKTLAQAHGEIAAALRAQKTAEALGTLHEQLDDALADHGTFDELARDKGLQAQVTAGLLPNGTDPDHPGQPDPALTPLVQAVYQMQAGDEPLLVPTGADGSFALVALGQVVPATARPLATVRNDVQRDVAGERAVLAARRVAGQILQRVNAGQTLQQAWTSTGLSAAGPKPISASRDDVDRAQGPTKQPLALMFAMAPGTTKLLEAPGGAGWAVIRLNAIQRGDASHDVARVNAVRQAFGGLIGREYAEQFARAAQREVGTSTNPAVVARVRAQLLGQGGSGGN
ncbi:SurA N-terminal domain-containing protein [Sphingomonas sp.]|uniref:peptidylprolyl isomerase n=1 Tax=Sphingomonas sp. TaxID=28214 RepID=UPI003CC672C8